MTTKIAWDALEVKSGHIAHDFTMNGIRVLIMRGPSAWNAYVGVNSDHPAAGFDYDEVPVSVHGGLTFSSAGGKKAGASFWLEGYWWYGWDYAHSGDCSTYRHEGKTSEIMSCHGEKHWSSDDVRKEAEWAISDFERVLRLAEKIQRKVSTKAPA